MNKDVKATYFKISLLGCLNDMQSNRFKEVLDKGLVSPRSDAHVRGVYDIALKNSWTKRSGMEQNTGVAVCFNIFLAQYTLLKTKLC